MNPVKGSDGILIRLLEEQSDHCLHYLPFHGSITVCLGLSEYLGKLYSCYFYSGTVQNKLLKVVLYCSAGLV